MAEEEQLNCEMLECLCLAIIEEKGIDDQFRTKKLLAFMLSGKEPFNVVLDVFSRVDHLGVYMAGFDKCSFSVSTKNRNIDRCLLANLPAILVNALFEYSKKLEINENFFCARLPFDCLARNKRLETIVFSPGYSTLFPECQPDVLCHLKHVDNIECPFPVFQDVLKHKIDVGFIHVNQRSGGLGCLYHVLGISRATEFSGLTRLKLSLPGGSAYCHFEREISGLKSILSRCEQIFPDLTTFEVVFLTGLDLDIKLLARQMAAVQRTVNSYTGRLKVLAEFVNVSAEHKLGINSFDHWVSRLTNDFPNYICVIDNGFPSFRVSTTSRQMTPNVKLTRVVRLNFC